jgi:hypothetical protein
VKPSTKDWGSKPLSLHRSALSCQRVKACSQYPRCAGKTDYSDKYGELSIHVTGGRRVQWSTGDSRAAAESTSSPAGRHLRASGAGAWPEPARTWRRSPRPQTGLPVSSRGSPVHRSQEEHDGHEPAARPIGRRASVPLRSATRLSHSARPASATRLASRGSAPDHRPA